MDAAEWNGGHDLITRNHGSARRIIVWVKDQLRLDAESLEIFRLNLDNECVCTERNPTL